jgi:hypothetical protein
MNAGTELADSKHTDPEGSSKPSGSTVSFVNSSSRHDSGNAVNLICISDMHPISDASFRGRKDAKKFVLQKRIESLPARLRTHPVTICSNALAFRRARNLAVTSPTVSESSRFLLRGTSS